MPAHNFHLSQLGVRTPVELAAYAGAPSDMVGSLDLQEARPDEHAPTPKTPVTGRRLAFRKELEIPVSHITKSIDFMMKSKQLRADFYMYIPFLVMFVFFFLAGRNVGSAWFLINSTRDSMVNTEFPNINVYKGFMDIGNKDDWNDWVRGVALEELWSYRVDDNSTYTYNTTESIHYHRGPNVLLGSLRFRTLRMTNTSCSVNTYLYPSDRAVLNRECYGEFASNAMQVNPYGGVNGSAFQFSRTSSGTRTTGEVDNYPVGGYLVEVDFQMSYTDARSTVYNMVSSGYVDNLATRFVTAELFSYNPTYNMFTSAKLICEVTAGGSWVPTTQIRAFKTWTKGDVGNTIYDLFFLMFVLYYIITFFAEWAVSYRRTKRILYYIIHFWNVLEIINITVFLIVFGMRFAWIAKSRVLTIQLPFPGRYPGELEQVVYLFSMQNYLNSVNTVLTFLKLLKFVRLNDRLNILTRTMEACQQNIFGVLVLFVFVVTGYAITGNTLFGNSMWDYRTVESSFSALMRMLLGDFDYSAMRQENRFLTGLYFWSFIILALFLLLNFIIAIITEGFSKVNTEKSSAPLDRQLIRFLKGVRHALSWEIIPKYFQVGKKSMVSQLRVVIDSINTTFPATKSEVKPNGNGRGSTFEINEITLTKNSFLTLIPEDTHKILGTMVLNNLWNDVAEDYEDFLSNDAEAERKEQEERLRANIESALDRPMMLLEDMEQRFETIEKALASITSNMGVKSFAKG